jgi:hypothetical protein
MNQKLLGGLFSRLIAELRTNETVPRQIPTATFRSQPFGFQGGVRFQRLIERYFLACCNSIQAISEHSTVFRIVSAN